MGISERWVQMQRPPREVEIRSKFMLVGVGEVEIDNAISVRIHKKVREIHEGRQSRMRKART